MNYTQISPLARNNAVEYNVRHEILNLTLHVAVPMAAADMFSLAQNAVEDPNDLAQVRAAVHARYASEIPTWVDRLASEADQMLYLTGPKGNTGQRAAELARILAVLSFTEGGVCFSGNRYETRPKPLWWTDSPS